MNGQRQLKQFAVSIGITVCVVWLLAVSGCCAAEEAESAAMKRFRTQGLKYEQDNEFFSEFTFSPAEGLGLEEGVSRRDPTSVIKVGNLYYVWYTRPPTGSPIVGVEKSTDTLRAYPWDLSDLWYATSPDGKNWTEQGLAVARGPKGSFDSRCVYTPDVLVADGRYYLFYQASSDDPQARRRDFAGNVVIGMSWANSPDGPWTRFPEPILKRGPEGAFDHEHVHDPSLIVREGKYWLYYKGTPGGSTRRDKKWGVPIAWGVATADKPEGPYVKSKLNPIICGGHETIVWPYRKGVCALLVQGPEKYSLQFAEDGLNFIPKAHGLDVPRAAGVYRVGNFTDTNKMPGQGITWGLYHITVRIAGKKWNYLMRFDCDLSLERGEQIRKKNEEM